MHPDEALIVPEQASRRKCPDRPASQPQQDWARLLQIAELALDGGDILFVLLHCFAQFPDPVEIGGVTGSLSRLQPFAQGELPTGISRILAFGVDFILQYLATDVIAPLLGRPVDTRKICRTGLVGGTFSRLASTAHRRGCTRQIDAPRPLAVHIREGHLAVFIDVLVDLRLRRRGDHEAKQQGYTGRKHGIEFSVPSHNGQKPNALTLSALKRKRAAQAALFVIARNYSE